MATIVTKNSSTASAVPTTSDLVQGELAVNVTDKRIFTENASTQIVELGTNPSTVTTATATVTGTLTANGTFASSNAVITGGSINSTPIGATTPSTVRGSTVTATTGFVGGLTGNVTGNLTGNVTGNVVGNVTGDLTGNVTASSGTSTVNNLVVNGTVDFTNTRLTDVAEPVAGSDAATKTYVDTSIAAVIDGAPAALDTLNELAAALNDDASFHTTVTNSLAGKLPLAGGTMTGQLSLGANKIVSVADPTLAQDAATKTYVDTADALKLNLTGGTMSGAIAMGTNKITGVGDPTLAQDAATKAYTDSILGSATSAADSAAAAATSASNAATSASNASTSETNAANSANSAASSYDQFDDRYLGDKASDPTLDNDGNALLTGALYFNTTSDDMKVYNGSAWQVTAINPADPTFTGTVTADGLSLGDNDKATFGNSNDLEIYHDGSSSFISDQGTGNLRLLAQNFVLADPTNTEAMIVAFPNGSVDLYYDNTEKLATTSTGIDVTGTATMDGLTVEAGNNVITLETADLGYIKVTSTARGGDYRLTTNGSNAEYFDIQNGTQKLVRFAESGDISFYEDTGTTPKFFWDASAESLGIGTSSPTNGPTGTFSGLNIEGTATNGELTALLVRNPDSTIDTAGKVSIEMKASSSNRRGPKITAFKEGTYADATTADAGLSFHTVVNDAYIDALTIKQSGNVGIGTSSPSKNLHVYNATTDRPALIESGDANSLLEFKDNSTTNAPAIGATSNDLIIQTGSSASERLRIDSSGNVGIGNTNPASYSSRLVVDGGRLTIASGNRMGFWDAANLGRFEINSPSYHALAFYTGDGSTECMRITSSGNVGIGTSSPSTKLHVNGGGSNTLALFESTDAGAAISFKDGNTTINPEVDCRTNDLVFNTNNAERMRIDSSGNVGIGTSSPASQLHLISANPEVRLQSNGANTTGEYSILSRDAANVAHKTSMKGVGSSLTFNTGGNSGNSYVPIERMRIDSSGNLLVGTTSLTTVTDTSATNGFYQAAGSGCYSKRSITTTANHYAFYNPNGQVGTIQTSASATSYNTSSDQRLKENIADANDAGSKVDAIQVRQFDWKADGSHQDYGMIAQELAVVAPEAVSVPENPEDMMGVDYSKLVPMLIKEIQSLRNRVATLEGN